MQKLSIILTLVLMMISSSLFAGSLDYLSNQSAKYIMNTASTARTEGADIAAYNPAGTALFGPGLYFDISNQTLFKFYSAKEKEVLLNEYKQSEPTFFLPNLYVVMSTGEFSVYFHAGVTGGGGALKWDNGSIGSNAFAQGVYGIIPLTSVLDGYSTSLEVSSIYYTISEGIAFSFFNNNASLSFGLKYIMAKRTGQINGKLNYAETTFSIVDEYDYSANGFTPVFGFDVKPADEFTFAIRYELRTKLKFKYKTKDLDVTSSDPTYDAIATAIMAGLPDFDGYKAKQDLPAILSLGIEYKITPNVVIGAATNIFLMSSANIQVINPAAGIVDNTYNFDTGYELAASLGYRVAEWLNFGGTIMYTNQGVKKDYLKDPDSLLTTSANPILNSIMFGLGATCMITNDLDITFAWNWAHYITKKFYIDAMRVKYKKDVYSFGFGAGFKI